MDSATAKATTRPAGKFPVMDIEEDFFTQFNIERGKCLGSGLTGSVFLTTRRNKPGKKCAIKILPLKGGRLSKERVRVAYQREINAFENTDHSGLAQCLMAVRCPDYFGIMMKYYPMGDLFANLDIIPSVNKPVMARQMVEAVDYLHKKELIHGDIKLENVLLDIGLKPVLTDFGNTRRVPDGATLVPAKGFGGTHAYWPRELRRQLVDTVVDPFKVDMYALGVVILSVAQARVPCSSTDHLSEASSSLKVLSAERPVLMSLLDTDYEKRCTADFAMKVYLSISSKPAHRG